MENTRIKISSIVESQLPSFVREDYPLVSELLTEYYRSLESKGSSYDILQNIDQYVKVNNLTNLVSSVSLTSDIGFADTTISASSTDGFPKNYGLILVDNEIILYKSKTATSFVDCTRGFSGVTEYSVGSSEDLVFSTSSIEEHSKTNADGSTNIIKNLSSLFLTEFFNKVKKQFLYGFDNRELYEGINQDLFLKQSKDFYSSKGTDRSFEILFRVLYGKDVEVILPKNYLIQPSDAQYRVTRNFVTESVQGNLEDLLGRTVFQTQYQDIPKSFGTVTDVQKIVRNNTQYYVLKLDYDFDKDINVSGSIFGNLKIHSKTSILDNLASGASTIVVDSTIGFAKSGELLINVEGEDILVTYDGKTVNQFLNCSGITQSIPKGTKVSLNTYAYGYGSNGSEIRFRITGVLSSVDLPDGSLYFEKGDRGRILTLGYNKNETLDNNWVFNKTVKCDVSTFSSAGGFKYLIETFDDNGIYEGDSVEIDYIDGTGQRNTSIIDGSNVKIPTGSIPGKKFQIETSGYSISNIFTVKKLISKFSNSFVSDVLNVYRDFSNDDRYVTSSSLPFYGSNPNLNIENFQIFLNGTFSDETLKIVGDGQNHGFITGDAVVYSRTGVSTQTNTLGIQTGVYFVKRISDTEIKLSRSRSNIDSGKFVSIASTSLTSNVNSLSPLKFCKKNNTPSTTDSQRVIKLIKSAQNDGNSYNTADGTTGILINGVEILNYKSKDFIYYGPIESIDVISPGRNFDVINPPVLEVSSGAGTTLTAKGYCHMDGSLIKIDVVDGGFDYIDLPIITITGGSGKGAVAVPKMIEYDHFVDFNSTSSNGQISLVSNIIGFSTYHKFRDGENIVYATNGNSGVGGLTTGAKYFVKVIDDYKVKLHKTYSDSLVGINTVDITSFGVGNHRFESTTKKKKVNSIIITDSGFGYKNKKISVAPTGINTASNIISVYNHPYLSGETIYYYGGDTNISGLSTGKYIVTKVDDSSFKLSQVGVGTTSQDFYYQTKQYVDLKSIGTGNHIFNYEPIEVKIEGKVGISTIANVDVTAKVQPVFRGKLTSVFVYDGGVGYGSSDIINYNKQPNFNLNAGSGARVTPIILNGKIVSVTINESGKDYNSPPNLIVRGLGVGAVLTPIISSGRLTEVKIINGGVNYAQKDTVIDVVVPGTGYELKSYPKTWTINNFERLVNTNKINPDDGVLYEGKNKDYGLQYTHLYSPRSLRKKVFCQNTKTGDVKYRSDYDNDITANTEKYHSPLLGWAYDGNPIYGPYGFDSPSNKKVRQILSGYGLPTDNALGRPNNKVFPAGYFIEDYEFAGQGDLDEHNGRFCVTPEFPNGTYAYFMTLTEENAEKTSGIFAGNKNPKFPYIIGNTYKSKPIDFNLSKNSTQENFDFSSEDIIRNTNPYNTLSKNSSYEYFLSTSDIETHNSKVKSATKGQVESIKIISGGENYKVNDRLVFDNENTGGTGVAAKVKYVKGKSITGISQTSTILYDVEFYPSTIPNVTVGFSSSPHNLSNGDLVYINSLSDFDKTLQNSFNVGVRSDNFILSLGVGNTAVTGIVTYFYISGLLNENYFRIRENDILTINSEDIKVLNVDERSSRIRVLRAQNSTVAAAHSAYSVLYERPRKFFINSDKSLKNKDYKFNKELYFIPSESLGIGTIVGIGYTVNFSNPGIGITSLIIPQKSIYIKNHGLETGNELIYKTNGGTPIVVSTSGVSTFSLSNNGVVYVAKLSEDFIGISTVKVGLGTTGEFVGISQTASTLFFANSGSGDYHSFVTNFNNVSKGNVSKTIVTVSTAATHSLKVNDYVFIDSSLGITTTINIRYSDYHRRLLVNPRSFSSIDTNNDLITINNHGYANGEKLIYTSASPASGLENQGIYYAIVYDENRIKLSNSYYGATSDNKSVVNITSSSSGTISQVNPKITVNKNQTVQFDLSDSSLSQPSLGVGATSTFDFQLFLDENFSSNYFPINADGISKITKTGNIGVTSNAKVQFTIDNDFPNFLYYNLVPDVPVESLPKEKEIIVDEEVDQNNKIIFVKDDLNGQKVVSGVTSTTFVFQNQKSLIFNSYTQTTNGNFEYYTDSINTSGEIHDLKIISGGDAYQRLPSISSITSSTGSGAILLPQSTSIGGIVTTTIENIGFDYSVDNTLRPTIKFPTILRIEPLSSIESIEVISQGLNYNTAPNFVVLDGFTNEVVDDIYLDYQLGDKFVRIIKNTKGLYNVTPKIVPINNSNGLGISSISYNNSTKKVTAFFTKQFSNPNTFPFSIGDRVFIEGVSVTGSTDKGYNSSNYDYATFPVVGVNTNLGGSGSCIDYSLDGYLTGSEVPGTFDSSNSSGRAISEDSFPTFNIKLSKNSYIIGEEIETDGLSGKVLKWDSKNEYLTIETTNDFYIDSLITGKISKSQAFIKEVLSYESFYKVDSSSIVIDGWNSSTGFLNDNLQRIHDSDYYQYFSYSLKSEVPFEDWKDVVSNLNHTLGFKKFSDLVVSSSPPNAGISTDQNDGSFSATSDLNSIVDVECVYDYDLVSENSFYVENTLTSDEIAFNSAILQDYSESVGNRALIIDDISQDFNTSISRVYVTSFNI